MDDLITKNPPWTEDELKKLRASMVEQFDIQSFTCDECGAKSKCQLVFDPYNEGGDCLAEK